MAHYYEEQDEINAINTGYNNLPISQPSTTPTAAAIPLSDTSSKESGVVGYKKAAYTAFSENFKEGISTGWKLGVIGYEYAKDFFYEQPFLTPEQYEQSQYKIAGKSYPSGVAENIAKIRFEEHQDKLRRAEVLSRLYEQYPKTTVVASLAGGISGSILDPAFIAATAICPATGVAATTARIAGLTKWGVVAAKDISLGVKFGLIGGTELYAKNKAYDEDAKVSDIVMSGFYGGAFGLGVTAVRGAIAGTKALHGHFVSPASDLAIKTRAISQLEEGKQVDIAPYFKAAASEEKHTTATLADIKQAKKEYIEEFKGKADKWDKLGALETEFKAKHDGVLEKLDDSPISSIHEFDAEIKGLNLPEADAKTLEEILSLRKEFAEDVSNITDYERLEAIADTNIPPPAFEEFVAAEAEKVERTEKIGNAEKSEKTVFSKDIKPLQGSTDPEAVEVIDQELLEKRIYETVKDYTQSNAGTKATKKINLNVGLQAYLAGITRRGINARNSIAAYVKARKNNTLLTFFENLKQGGAADYFASKNPVAEIEIAKALCGEATEDALALQVAKAFKPLQEELRATINKLGGKVDVKEGYIAHFSHDPIKTAYTHETALERLQHRFSKLPHPFIDETASNEAAFKRWKSTHLPLLDHEKTFGDMDLRKRETALRNMFNRIVAREKYKDAEFGIAEKWSRSQFFVYKDAASFLKANRIYGQGNVYDAMINTLKGESQTIALAEKFGLNPKATFENVLEKLKRTEGVTPAEIKKLERQRLVFDNLVGNSPYDTSSTITNNLLTWEYLTKAANITIASFNDVVHQTAVQQKLFGKSAFGAFLNTLRTQPKEFIKVLAESIGKEKLTKKDLSVTAELARVMALDLHSRYNDAPINKLAHIMNAISGINAWDTASIRHATICTSRELFLNSKHTFDKLNTDLRKTLLQYGIESRDWDLIRKNPFKDKNGRGYITVDTSNYSKESVIEYLGKKSTAVEQITQKKIDAVGKQARFKLLIMNQDIADYYRLVPDAYERTLPGMRSKDFLTRTFMQFKGYPIALTRRILSLVMENSIEGFKENGFVGGLKAAPKDLIPAATYIGEGLALGYVTNSLLRLTQGKTPLDPTKPDTWKKAAIYSGVGGLYSIALDRLTQQQTTHSDVIASLAAPVWSDINHVGQAIMGGISGKKKVANYNFYKLISGNIPLVNLPYTKEAFNYLIGWRAFEFMAPSAFRKMVKKEKGNWLVDPRDYLGS